ncbi:UDP-N-acetyl-D-mannosamine dehydrogenase [Terrabacter sp. 2RAF25]|uniref:UDP-N-acetyl-D-mannosamine dehydrogenase n=1 Tax=Terrabacter sp. 2RAF25 TaxID=3232998 RepID=UPI003F98BB17
MDHGVIAVIGLGYIGLPTAAALATRGVRVHGVDVNERTVEAVNKGEVPFVEPDLGVAVSGAVSKGLLSASTTVPHADAFLVAVPTPFLDDRSADLSYIRTAAEAIAPQLQSGNVVVLESTSPPGTTRQMGDWLAKLRPDLAFPSSGAAAIDVHVAHCPERVLPGRVMIELVTNDRVVGGLTPECGQVAAEIYRVFCQGEIVITDAGSAEMSKLAENAFRDVNLAFANELSIVCDSLGLDVWEIIRSANRHPRVNILNPGPGVGGHCIAVDPWFIVAAAPEQARLMRTAREVNDSKPGRVVDQVKERAARLHSPVVACLGLAFKANIDDLRESPAMEVVEGIRRELPDATLLAVEPHVESLPDRLKGQDIAFSDAQSAIEAADIVVLLVDHSAFRSINRKSLEGRIVFDTRGFWNQH